MANWRKWYRDASTSKSIWIRTKDPRSPMVWPYLLPHFDDEGRMEYHPVATKAEVLPLCHDLTPDDFDLCVNDLCQAGLLIRYSVNGSEYIAVPAEKWGKRQPIRNDRFRKSECPPATNGCQLVARRLPYNKEDDNDNDNDKKRDGGCGTPKNGVQTPAPDPTVEWFKSTAFGVSKIAKVEALVARLWQIAKRAGFDPELEVQKASAWAENNPQRAPKKRVNVFYTRWFNRAAEDVRQSGRRAESNAEDEDEKIKRYQEQMV